MPAVELESKRERRQLLLQRTVPSARSVQPSILIHFRETKKDRGDVQKGQSLHRLLPYMVTTGLLRSVHDEEEKKVIIEGRRGKLGQWRLQAHRFCDDIRKIVWLFEFLKLAPFHFSRQPRHHRKRQIEKKMWEARRGSQVRKKESRKQWSDKKELRPRKRVSRAYAEEESARMGNKRIKSIITFIEI